MPYGMTRKRAHAKHSKVIESNIPNFSTIKKSYKNNTPQSIEKYVNLAREAMIGGDRVLAEGYYQQAEHYLRLNCDPKKALGN